MLKLERTKNGTRVTHTIGGIEDSYERKETKFHLEVTKEGEVTLATLDGEDDDS